MYLYKRVLDRDLDDSAGLRHAGIELATRQVLESFLIRPVRMKNPIGLVANGVFVKAVLDSVDLVASGILNSSPDEQDL